MLGEVGQIVEPARLPILDGERLKQVQTLRVGHRCLGVVLLAAGHIAQAVERVGQQPAVAHRPTQLHAPRQLGVCRRQVARRAGQLAEREARGRQQPAVSGRARHHQHLLQPGAGVRVTAVAQHPEERIARRGQLRWIPQRLGDALALVEPGAPPPAPRAASRTPRHPTVP